MQKIKYINWLFPVLLLIKESFNLIKADTTGYTQPRSGSPRCYFLLMTILMKKLRALDSSHRYWWSKDPGICLDERHNWPHPTKICSLICYLHFMIISCKKSKRSINSSQRYSWSKWLHPPKSGSLRCCLPNMIAPCKETKISLDSITPCKKISTLLETFQKYWWSKHSAIGWEVQLATSNQEVVTDVTLAWWLSSNKK